MVKKDAKPEVHWGGLLWQDGKDGPFFLRKDKSGDKEEIEEGPLGAKASLEDACAIAFRTEVQHLRDE